MATKPAVVVQVSEPELIKEAIVNNARKLRRPWTFETLRRVRGDGLLTAEEPAHLRHRRMIQPQFHRRRIEGYAEAMVRHARAREREPMLTLRAKGGIPLYPERRWFRSRRRIASTRRRFAPKSQIGAMRDVERTWMTHSSRATAHSTSSRNPSGVRNTAWRTSSVASSTVAPFIPASTVRSSRNVASGSLPASSGRIRCHRARAFRLVTQVGVHGIGLNRSGTAQGLRIGRIRAEGRTTEWCTRLSATTIPVCRPSGSPVFGFTSNRG